MTELLAAAGGWEKNVEVAVLGIVGLMVGL